MGNWNDLDEMAGIKYRLNNFEMVSSSSCELFSLIKIKRNKKGHYKIYLHDISKTEFKRIAQEQNWVEQIRDEYAIIFDTKDSCFQKKCMSIDITWTDNGIDD